MSDIRTTIGKSVLAAMALALLGLAAPAGSSAQEAGETGEIRVLVAPLTVHDGVRERFGERTANRVRDELGEFSGMRAIEWREIRNTLREFDLDASDMTPIEWRQLASRLNAGMVMVGDARRTAEGVRVEVRFLDPRTGDELPVQAFTVEDDGKDREAAAQISAGLEEQVEFQRAVVFCAEYLASQQMEDAARNCQRALAINPRSMRALYLQGRIHMAAEDWTAAKENLEVVVEDNPSNTDALQSLAYTEAQLGNTRQAQRLYQEYLNFNPDAADVRLNVAFEMASAGAYREAVEILQEGVRRDSTSAILWEYLGNVALAQGTARPGPDATFDPEADPEAADPEAMDPGADGSVRDEDAVRLAVRAYDKVFELRGDEVDPSILNNVIAARMELGELEEALAFSERALERIRQMEEEAAPGATAAPDTMEEVEGTAPDTMEEVEGTDLDETQDPLAEGVEQEVADEDELLGRDQPREQILARLHDLRATIYNRMDRPNDALRELNLVLETDPDYQNVRMRLGTMKLRTGDTDGALREFQTAVREGQDPHAVANMLFARGYQNHFQRDQFSQAIAMFSQALEFAEQPELREQINFFTAFGHYQMGARLDNENQAERCEPARRALSQFQQVTPYLQRSGGYQQQSQNQIREALDVQIYRQEQIIRSAC